MKKDKRTPTQKKAAIKRGKKRSDRLKKTQAEKPERKAKIIAEKKAQEKKIQDAIDKLLQSRKVK